MLLGNFTNGCYLCAMSDALGPYRSAAMTSRPTPAVIPAQASRKLAHGLVAGCVWFVPSLVVMMVGQSLGAPPALCVPSFLVLWTALIAARVRRLGIRVRADALVVPGTFGSRTIPWETIDSLAFKVGRGSNGDVIPGLLDVELCLRSGHPGGDTRNVSIADVPAWLDVRRRSQPTTPPPPLAKGRRRELSALGALMTVLAAHDVKVQAIEDDGSPLRSVAVEVARATLGSRLLVAMKDHPIVQAIWALDGQWAKPAQLGDSRVHKDSPGA